MPIKNYTTKVPAVQTVGEIQGILAAHGARKVMMDYAENGKVTAVTFALDCCGSLHGFRLEARPDGVKAVMAKERTKCDDEQAERIAWRNLKDWIAAQVALVETEQATMDELFFPKLVDRNEKTLYEVFQTGQLNPRSVIKGPSDKQTSHLHPTQKPVWLCERLVLTYTNPGEVVLDCCAGSASVGVACCRTGRRYIGIENEKQYYDVMRTRLRECCRSHSKEVG